MDGGGITTTGRGVHIVDWQLDGELAAPVPDHQVTTPADVGNAPTIAVLDPVSGRESEPAVVRTGDDHISDTRPVPVPQTHLLPDRDVAEAMITGSAVELSNELPGRRQHDHV